MPAEKAGHFIHQVKEGSGLNDTVRFKRDSDPLKSNYFTGGEKATSTTGDLEIWTQINYIGITDRDSKWADVAALKTWLGTYKPVVYYPEPIPEEIPITNQTLINQLNALKNDGQSYFDITNINVITQNAQPTIEAKAYEKI